MQTFALKWFEIAWPVKGDGHRFFRNAGGTLFIADLSGPNPDLTNDGPLAVLPGRMDVVVEDGRARVFVNVLSERTHKISSTVMDTITARWLLRESGMDFKVTCNIPGLKELLS
jgi:hypothetical protein